MSTFYLITLYLTNYFTTKLDFKGELLFYNLLYMATLHNNLFISIRNNHEVIFNQKNNIIQQLCFYRHMNFKIKYGFDVDSYIQELSTKEPITINEACFLFVSDFDGNFHHFMIELLPIFHFFKSIRRRVNKNTKLVIRESATFPYQFLKLLGIEDKHILKLDSEELYLFEKIFLINPRLKKKALTYLGEACSLLYKHPIEHKPDKIILIRKNNKRVCVNYDLFKQIGDEYGFFPYSPEDDTLDNQVSLMHNCSILLCELGAGCCNFMFMQPKKKVIIMDFFPEWCDLYVKYNNMFKHHELTRIPCHKIKGTQHNCSWRASIQILKDNLEILKDSI